MPQKFADVSLSGIRDMIAGFDDGNAVVMTRGWLRLSIKAGMIVDFFHIGVSTLLFGLLVGCCYYVCVFGVSLLWIFDSSIYD